MTSKRTMAGRGTGERSAKWIRTRIEEPFPRWTRGPWRAHVFLSGRGHAWNIAPDGYSPVARTYTGGHSGEEAEANAQLIAASPDLAAAARPFAEMLDTHEEASHAARQVGGHLPCDDDFNVSVPIKWLRAARAALLKAER